MYHNLMMLDKVLNSKLGNIKNPQLNLALGAVSNIYADIDIKPIVPIDQFVNYDTTFYTCVDFQKLKLTIIHVLQY